MENEIVELMSGLLKHTKTGGIRWKLYRHPSVDDSTPCYSAKMGEDVLMIYKSKGQVVLTLLDGQGKGVCTFPSAHETDLLFEAVEENAVNTIFVELREEMEAEKKCA